MAYRLVHRTAAQEVRFPTKPAAERYAAQFGGAMERWEIVAAGQAAAHPSGVRRPILVGHDEPT